MKRNAILILIAMISAICSVLLIIGMRREVLGRLNNLKRSMQLRNNTYFPIQEAGHPYSDNLENSKMVSEGSQYGIDYYNRLQ